MEYWNSGTLGEKRKEEVLVESMLTHSSNIPSFYYSIVLEGNMKRIGIGSIVFVMLLLAVAVYAQPVQKKFTPEEITKMSETTAFIETPLGIIQLKFFPEVAPNHVKNFIDLAKKGFYDGTIFHRVIPGFMIQGGDPNSKSTDKSRHGMGGPGYTVKAEFNDKPHKRGTLSMARSQDPDSAGSQFFICVADAAFLNKQYTAFGEVISGMNVADKIVNQPRDKRDNPNERIEMTVRIVEK
jgi:peptidyl-prolyl cis-trans isomerase B (cyclophilin B)